MSRALVPSDATLESWKVVADAAAHHGLSKETWQLVAQELGDRELDDLVLLESIPPQAFAGALEVVKPNHLDRARLAPFVDVQTTVERTEPGPLESGDSSSAPASARIRVSSVLDQEHELELSMLPHTELFELRRNYVMVLGDAPLEKEDVTDAQLSALKHWVEIGFAPAVDFGVWSAHGARLERRLALSN
eukprot:4434395-Amphidinium_carterae.1